MAAFLAATIAQASAIIVPAGARVAC
ncbi:MAG: hypothetical protein QOK02_976, partial [Mycobacterium sp.]|nr:hypothetical protein [Mycobacterium sp.]